MKKKQLMRVAWIIVAFLMILSMLFFTAMPLFY